LANRRGEWASEEEGGSVGDKIPIKSRIRVLLGKWVGMCGGPAYRKINKEKELKVNS